MAKTVVKKKTTRKPAAKKAPIAKKVASAKLKAKPAVAKIKDKHDNFMWRLLKKKEAERQKLMAEKPHGHSADYGSGTIGAAHGFSRFSGPRRRVG